MTKGHRFKTYTQLEKTYRRVLGRRTREKHGKRLTQYREIADAARASAWPGKNRWDSLTPLRPMTIEREVKTRPLPHNAYALERITA
jgi:hypothetical protein